MYIPESPVGSEILGPKNHQNQTVLGLKFDTQTEGLGIYIYIHMCVYLCKTDSSAYPIYTSWTNL